MTKAELIDAVCDKVAKEKCHITKPYAEAAANAVFQIIGDCLASGGSIILPNFGTFKVVERAARKGRNPRTGEEIEIPAAKVVSFNASRELKKRVNGG